jgi:hypothetical protein
MELLRGLRSDELRESCASGGGATKSLARLVKISTE